MNFAHRLLETISYATSASLNASGDVTFATVATCKARITKKLSTVSNSNGEGEVSNYVVETTVHLPIETRVWLPGVSTASVNDSLRVISSEYASTLDGAYTLYIAYC